MAWVDRCARDTGVAMRLESCPSAVAIVALGPSASPLLRAEISTAPTAFRRKGAFGVSPIGSFPDWKLEPAPTRAAFDALVSCMEREPPEALLPRDAPPPVRTGSPAPRRLAPPWLLFGLIGAVAAACVAAGRSMWRALGVALAALTTIVVARSVGASPAFFHQNGQGPEWIRYALQGDAGGYGAGYPELYGWLASRTRRPDLAIFRAQQLLAATVPISAYAIARAVSGTRLVAVLVAALLVFDPLLSRLARSESYYVPITAFVFAGTALLLAADRARRPGPRVALTVASALAVAQAARVHPLAWTACAVIPLAVACRPGRLGRRALRALASALAVGAGALLFVLPGIRAALADQLGHSAGFARAHALQLAPALGLVIALAAATAWGRRTRVVGSRVLVVVIVVAVALAADLLANNIESVHRAYLHLYLPVLVAAVAAVAQTRASAGVLAAILTMHAYRERPHVAWTTDTHELAWCVGWRETLPAGAEVAAVMRAGERLVILPLLGAGLPRSVPVEADGSARYTAATRYYYRSSLCSTPDGAPLCSRFESTHHLEPVGHRRFPARESAPWMRFPEDTVEVALFVVR